MRIVFVGPEGQPPNDQPAETGTTAINQDTNELWFVNSGLRWQKVIGQ